jgi:hypothetical protein
MAGVGRTTAVIIAAVAVANHPFVLSLVGLVPVVGGLPLAPATGRKLAFEVATTAAVALVALGPLFKPRPRRILDTASIAAKRTLLTMVTLAAVGYFDYTYRLPRSTLLVTTALLLLALPGWFVAIRRRSRKAGERTIIVGDDTDVMADILGDINNQVLGYVFSPGVTPPSIAAESTAEPARSVPDGGHVLAHLLSLGGLSRLNEVLVEHDVDTIVLAFAEPDRAEFFGALDTC